MIGDLVSQRKSIKQAERRAFRVRESVKRNGLPRVSVFRSLNHIYAQLIDDQQGVTLASASSIALKIVGDKKTVARTVGQKLAEMAKAVQVEAVVFDRGPYRYHGRVEELADGLRDGGLKL